MNTPEAFDEYFNSVYGERWPGLKSSLLIAPKRATLQNPFGSGLQNYSLDEASVLAAQALDVQRGENIADLCASPGGKTLVSVFQLMGDANWICNDLSPGRVARLRAVLHDCLPPEVLARVQVIKGDGSTFGMRNKGMYDRVLVDAPCSGERHLLETPKEIARWSLKGSKRLAVRQHALLCSGVDALKPGGRAVYSTCSVSPVENDGVIAKIMKSRAGKLRLLKPAFAIGEPTEMGWIVLPDRTGSGPIYIAVLERTDG